MTVLDNKSVEFRMSLLESRVEGFLEDYVRHRRRLEKTVLIALTFVAVKVAIRVIR